MSESLEGVRGTYVEAVGDDFHGDAFKVGEGLDFREPERLMRLDEAEEVLHLGSVTLWVCDGEHKGSYGGEKEVDSHVLPLDFSVL